MRKNLLWISLIALLILSVLSGLSVNTTTVSAAEYPAVYVDPASIVDPNLTPGDNFTISIRTNYTGNDICIWQFNLDYNPFVLHITSVDNGDLITEGRIYRSECGYNDAVGVFIPGGYSNDEGYLNLTVGYYEIDYEPMEVVEGPGILANVTFEVVGIGVSNITLGSLTKLKGYTDVGWDWCPYCHKYELWGGWGDFYTITDGGKNPERLGHGYFINVQDQHDVAVVSLEAPSTAIAEQPVPIEVTVGNEGNETESVTVTVYRDTTQIDTTSFNLASGLFKTVSFTWDTAGLSGTHTINATATIVAGDEDLSDNNRTKQITLQSVHDVAVVSLEVDFLNGVGESVPIEVTVLNEGSFDETVTVTVYRDSTQIDTDTFALNKGPTSKNVSFTWNTMGLPTGDYTINATATITVTDQDLSDNNKTKTVRLRPGDVAVTNIVPDGESQTDTWTGNGAKTTFTLTKGPIVRDSEEVYLNLTIMRKPKNYTINYAAGTITLNTTPGVGAEIKATYLYSQVYTKRTIDITVTVKNLGDTRANFTVTAYYNESSWHKIGTPQNVTNLPSDSPTTLRFNWNLSGVSLGNHTIKANATIIIPTEEANLGNNEFVYDGLVKVLQNDHDVAVTSIVAPATATPGDLVSINVTVANVGSSAEYVTVTLYNGTTQIGTDSFTLASWLFKTVPFTWNTAGLSTGEYTINATATITGDQDLSDNNKTKTVRLVVGGDVAVTKVVPEETQVYPTWTIDITVTVKNLGMTPANFTVAAYYSESNWYQIGTPQTVTNLPAESPKNLTFSWNLKLLGVDYCYHAIKANATFEGDTNTTNNEGSSSVKVKFEGDIDNDSYVGSGDVFVLAPAYGSIPGAFNWNRQADLDGDNYVGSGDVFVLAPNYGKTYCST